ncbi:MAG: CbiX/SirB N-terminal domain-containing protein [Nitrospirae bacterium]|nr:CbiX/SirB N-terminal domain-containing protein [Candidatus Manganitrophaceae bacterium]
MKRVVVLAVHGAPAADFPRKEAAELFDLRAKLRQASGEGRAALAQRHDALDAKMRGWPRTEENDPFFYGSISLAAHLQKEMKCDVIVGFNEFCAPSVDEALDQAAERNPEQVVVLTPMMTPGGAHSKSDIPAAIEQAQARHPRISFSYAWPFEASEIAKFLAAQVQRFVSKG